MKNMLVVAAVLVAVGLINALLQPRWSPLEQRGRELQRAGKAVSESRQRQARLPGQPVADSKTRAGGRLDADSNDLNLLAHLVYAEARAEPYIGQVAVAAVVLNRVESPSFPNTIPGVIYEPGAFASVYNGEIDRTPNAMAYRAARDAVEGWDPTGGALYFFNPSKGASGWLRRRPVVTVIARHVFTR